MILRHRRPRLAWFAALTAAFAALFVLAGSMSNPSSAQTRRSRHKAPAAKPVQDKEPAEAADASAPMTGKGEAASAASKPTHTDTGAVEAKISDGGARSFRFGEMEIEGRLRTPQLVYFLRRVRAEFAAGDLGHRTFMRELSETRKDPNF